MSTQQASESTNCLETINIGGWKMWKSNRRALSRIAPTTLHSTSLNGEWLFWLLSDQARQHGCHHCPGARRDQEAQPPQRHQHGRAAGRMDHGGLAPGAHRVPDAHLHAGLAQKHFLAPEELWVLPNPSSSDLVVSSDQKIPLQK